MNIKKLELFLAIARYGSFSKGAESVCITQSTASQHIASLEERCGVRLLDRTGNGVKPTEAGKILQLHAQRVIKSLQETEQAIIRFRQADGIELLVGGSSIPGTYLLPQVVARLHGISPGIRVTVQTGDSQETVARLLAEEVEIGIVGKTVDESLFNAQTLGDDRIILVAKAGHSWCNKKYITETELYNEPYIMRESGSGTNDVVETVLKENGMRLKNLKVCATFTSSESVKQAVLAGCGVAFISEMAIGEELKQKKLVAVKLPGITITRSFFLLQRKGRSMSPAAESFSTILRQVCHEQCFLPAID